MRVDVVIPSTGRPSLTPLFQALAPQRELLDGGRVIVIDDRLDPRPPLRPPDFAEVLPGGSRGPAAARNVGWRTAGAEWIAFLDDDVVPADNWAKELQADLAVLPASVAASQGRLRVPLGRGRRPTDWERNVAGLESARWISADMALRHEALAAVAGFDERFGGAYREDTDLALRLLRDGWQIVAGERQCSHPVPPAGFWTSVARQRGNADDVLMRALHGRHWRRWGAAPAGGLRRHLATTGVLACAGVAAAAGHRRTAAALGAAWLGTTAQLALARIAPGPRDSAELTRMTTTSVVLPLAASAWWARGISRLPRLLAKERFTPSARAPRPGELEAVLLDRDGTILIDVPYNGDPGKVVPMPGAQRALARLREAGLPLAVISNQSAVGRGLIDGDEVEAVNRRAELLLGPVDLWLFCPHGPGEDCRCRKPEPGLLLAAARQLGVRPERCVMIGDIATDVQAAQAAGAAAILVPTERTRREDVRRAPLVAPTIEAAVDGILEGLRPKPEAGR